MKKYKYKSFNLNKTKCPYCKKRIDSLLVAHKDWHVITKDIPAYRSDVTIFCPLCNKALTPKDVFNIYKTQT